MGIIMGWLGWFFCEITFRYFEHDWLDVPLDEREWRWYHRISYGIGVLPYRIGCWCYEQDPDW